uniref:Uncharacterized protein n=1 Tax=Anopheles atroparvus TaxID=41427 RepID=A0A182IJR8_ANOAO
MLLDSNLGRTFLFLSKLAWKNRVALPALIMVGYMVSNFRWEIEINIHAERIAVQDLPGRPYGAAFDGNAIDHLDDYSDEADDDFDQYYYNDYGYDEEDEDDLYYSSTDEEDEDGEEPGRLDTLNGTIRINRYAVVNFQRP